jgi:chromosome segregation ATPase
MGFMDKVKAAAQDAAAQAKTATGQAQTKLNQAQMKKKLDAAAEQLGHAVYNERAKGVPAADADRLVAEMKDLEEKIAALASASPGGEAASTPPPPPEGAG